VRNKDQQPVGGPRAQQEFIAKQAPAYYAVTFTHLGLNLLLSLGQLIAAIGLLSMKPSARTAAIVFTVIKVTLAMLEHVYSAIYVIPAQREFFDLNPPPQGAPFDVGAFTQMLGSVVLVIAAAFQLGIAGLVIGLLLTRSAREGFDAAAAPPMPEEEKPRSGYEGYDDDGYNPPPPETGIQDRPS
jgi:uncharacterized membrane protein (DUF485 family)